MTRNLDGGLDGPDSMWVPQVGGALPGITDPEVKELFAELRDEELEHIDMLKEAMAKLPERASVETENDPDDAPYL